MSHNIAKKSNEWLLYQVIAITDAAYCILNHCSIQTQEKDHDSWFYDTLITNTNTIRRASICRMLWYVSIHNWNHFNQAAWFTWVGEAFIQYATVVSDIEVNDLQARFELLFKALIDVQPNLQIVPNQAKKQDLSLCHVQYSIRTARKLSRTL